MKEYWNVFVISLIFFFLGMVTWFYDIARKKRDEDKDESY